VVPWTKESVELFFDELEEINRALLSVAARAVVAGKELSEEDAAETLELSTREIRGLVREINEGAQRNKSEPLVVLREATVQLRNGRTVQRRLFAMNESVARMVRAYERASLPNVEIGTAEGAEGPSE
jgi:dsDNA-specific endonuclease/ATPase MutS2